MATKSGLSPPPLLYNKLNLDPKAQAPILCRPQSKTDQMLRTASVL